MTARRITRTLATLLAGWALAYLAALAIEAYEHAKHHPPWPHADSPIADWWQGEL